MTKELRHVAIIMDGNRRWAAQRGLTKVIGHQTGTKSLQSIVETCVEQGIPYLTLFAFSSENWQRPEEEVDGLMKILKSYLDKELQAFHERKVRLRVIGDRSKLDPSICLGIAKAETLTRNNKNLSLTIALSYGGRQDIIAAANICASNIQHGHITKIDESAFSNALLTYDLPDPDLLIRTGGEKRLSNFLLWQLAYTELYFTDILWPDFSQSDFLTAISEFKHRERRYGII